VKVYIVSRWLIYGKVPQEINVMEGNAEWFLLWKKPSGNIRRLSITGRKITTHTLSLSS